MPKHIVIAATLALMLQAGCASAQTAPASQPDAAKISEKPSQNIPPVRRTSCQSERFSLDINFPSGAMRSCEVTGKSRIKVFIAPEDAPPINMSPWYAFRLTPVKPGPVTVEISYDHGAHRYWPKTSTNGSDWTPLPRKSILPVLANGETIAKRVILKLKLNKSPVLLAGQEIIVPSTYDAWLTEAARHPDVRRWELGKSKEGRAIEALTVTSSSSKPKEQVVLIGRQHPPEVTGALAMFHFADTLLADSDLAKRYRARFETIIVPLVNPDGVVRGFWRHSTGGIDLNRDWGPFTQPETKLFQVLLEGIESDPDRDLRMFIDFHSTRKDLVYTIPDAFVTDPPGLVSQWLDRYQQRMGEYEVVIEPGHNAERPVSKAYIYEQFKAPSATFELGDETDRELIKKIGREAAIAMMEAMLASEAP